MIKKIKYTSKKRVESGPVQFGDDWTGLFLRGDDCCGLRIELLRLLPKTENETLSDVMNTMIIKEVIEHIDEVLGRKQNEL